MAASNACKVREIISIFLLKSKLCLGYPKCAGGHHKVQEGLADQHVAAVPEGEGQPRPQGRVRHLRGLQDVAHQVHPDQCWRHVHCQECWEHGSSQVDILSEKQKHLKKN